LMYIREFHSAVVNPESAIIINGSFASPKNAFSKRFFAENGQFQLPGTGVNHN
jgi:hypothetical protein